MTKIINVFPALIFSGSYVIPFLGEWIPLLCSLLQNQYIPLSNYNVTFSSIISTLAHNICVKGLTAKGLGHFYKTYKDIMYFTLDHVNHSSGTL